jgi:hypothetical protein
MRNPKIKAYRTTSVCVRNAYRARPAFVVTPLNPEAA